MNSLNDIRRSEFLQNALEEGLALVARARFTLKHGYYSQGSATAVQVLVGPDVADIRNRRIQILCHAGGHLKIDWEGVAIILVDLSNGEGRLNFLDAQGKTDFNVKFSEEAAYRLSVPHSRLAVAVEAKSLAAVAADVGHKGSPLHFEAVSVDQLLEATADLKPGPELQVVLRARQSRTGQHPLRNSRVHLVIRSREKKTIFLQASIDLDLEDGLAGAWRTSQGLQSLTEDAELLIFAASPEREV